jgi:hypothetical protein
MNQEIKNAIEAKFGVTDVKFYSEGDEGCYYYDENKNHSEWNEKGELIYSEHGFQEIEKINCPANSECKFN